MDGNKCAILIPYYEAGDQLLATLDSIDASIPDTVVFVVDDGSTQTPARDILKETNSSLRVQLIELNRNSGIAAALNAGLSRIGQDFEYIARLDCGDKAQHDRFAKQTAFLDMNPDCALVGSAVDFVDERDNFLYRAEYPTTPDGIYRYMFVNCAFIHPSVMFRSKLIQEIGQYPVDRPSAEDYAFFFKIAKRYVTANLPESLVSCLVSPTGISTQRRREQLSSRLRIMLENFEARPIAVYGLVRTVLLATTPRSFTVLLNRIRGAARNRAGSKRLETRARHSAELE